MHPNPQTSDGQALELMVGERSALPLLAPPAFHYFRHYNTFE